MQIFRLLDPLLPLEKPGQEPPDLSNYNKDAFPTVSTIISQLLITLNNVTEVTFDDLFLQLILSTCLFSE